MRGWRHGAPGGLPKPPVCPDRDLSTADPETFAESDPVAGLLMVQTLFVIRLTAHLEPAGWNPDIRLSVDGVTILRVPKGGFILHGR